MTLSKRHHFVPQMLLRRFLASNGKLYAFNKHEPEKGIFTPTPKSLFVGKHLYSDTDKTGEKDDWLEKHFSKIEGQVNLIIEKIIMAVRSGKKPGLKAEEKELWDLFFYYQWKRVPEFDESLNIFSEFEIHIEEAVKEFELSFRPLTNEEKTELKTPEALARIKQSAKNKSLADPGKDVQKILNNKGLGIAVIRKPNKSFIIGSQPVAKFTFPERTHLGDDTVEVWLPIAPDIAISPAPKRETEILIQVSDKDIRHINEGIFSQSTIVAGRSEALIKSLANIR
jgi:hypothetical protein